MHRRRLPPVRGNLSLRNRKSPTPRLEPKILHPPPLPPNRHHALQMRVARHGSNDSVVCGYFVRQHQCPWSNRCPRSHGHRRFDPHQRSNRINDWHHGIDGCDGQHQPAHRPRVVDFSNNDGRDRQCGGCGGFACCYRCDRCSHVGAGSQRRIGIIKPIPKKNRTIQIRCACAATTRSVRKTTFVCQSNH